MFEHLQEISERASIESMTRTAEQFLDNHPIARARDLYRWLWEGEFGPGTRHQPTRLDELTQMIRTARMHKSAGSQPMWEPLGLTCRFVHVNLIPYNTNPAIDYVESDNASIQKFKKILEDE